MIWNYAFNRPLEQLQRKTINPKFFRIEVGKWLMDMKNHWSHIETESEEERLAKEKAINQNIKSAMSTVGYDLDEFMLSHAYNLIEDSYVRQYFLVRVCLEHSPSRTFMPHNLDEYNEGDNIHIFSRAEDMRWGDKKDVSDTDILCRYFFCETEEDIWDIFADGVGDIRDLCHYYTNTEKAMRMLLHIFNDDDKLLKAMTGKSHKVCPNSVKEEIVSILKDEFFDGMRDGFFNENNYDRALTAWETGIPAIRNEFVRDNHSVEMLKMIMAQNKPLVNSLEEATAMKSEDEVFGQIRLALKQFSHKYIFRMTVLVPSANSHSPKIVDLITTYNRQIAITDDLFRKLTVEEMWEEVIAFGSLFRQTFKTKEQFDVAIKQLEDDMNTMGEYFKIHLISDSKIRNCIGNIIKANYPKVWKYIEAINDRNILIVDDNVGSLFKEDGKEKKTIIYLHGYGSSGMSNTVSYLRKLLPECQIIAPDIPIDPRQALPFLRSLCEKEKPNLIIGTSMGAMYAMQMLDYHRICVNPALRMSELPDVLKVGTFDYFQPTASGETSFTITDEIIQHFKEMEQHLFDGLTDESRQLCWGFFGDEDTTVNCKEEFQRHYPNIIDFHGGHRMNNAIMREVIVPFVRKLIEEDSSNGIDGEKSVQKACEELKAYYNPKSITVLALSPDRHEVILNPVSII